MTEPNRRPLEPLQTFFNQTFKTYESDKLIVGQVDIEGQRTVALLQVCENPESALIMPLSPERTRQLVASLLNHLDEVEIHHQKTEED
jgi:hypothetical protein